MEKSKTELSVEKLYQMYNKKTLNFDLVIQRKEGIWDDERQGLLIDSILNDYFIPPLYVKKEGRLHSFLDGKQRLTSIFRFINNELLLPKDLENVDGVEIKNKKFEDLPKEFQERILNYKLDLVSMSNCTESDIKKIFYRLNHGVALKTIETTRAVLGNKVLKFIDGISKTPFFSTKINISKSARQRYVDQELILQTVMLISKADTGFSSKEIHAFSLSLNNESLRDELAAKMQNSCFYLNEVYLKKAKFLKKVNIPMLFKLAYDIQNNKWAITHGEFYKWSVEFFSNVPDEYKKVSVSGSSKKDSVKKRLTILTDSFNNYFKDIIGENPMDEEKIETSK